MMPNQTTLRILLYKYRDFIFPVGIILVCLLVIILILFPQGLALLAQENDMQSTRTQIATLQQNLSTIEGFDTSQMQLDMARVNKALPLSKDFGSVIDTLQRAATIAQVSLSDYTFQVGDLTDAKQVPGKVSTFQVSLVLVGDAKSIATFLHTITHQLPLADISEVRGNMQNASITLVFYYLPQSKVTVQATDTFSPLVATELQTLSTLTAYDTSH